jgi:hypothetical protein
MANQEHAAFETLEGQGFPVVRQVSVFLENRVGQLLRLTQTLGNNGIKIVALSIVESADFAVVRLMFDRTDEALAALKADGFTVSVTELLVVCLPPGKRGLLTVWSALLSNEVNVGFAYPLIPLAAGPAIAFSVDSLEMAIDALQRNKLTLLGEPDLQREP